MPRRHVRTSLILSAALVLLIAAGGCNPFKPDEDPEVNPDPGEILDRTTRLNLVEFFAKAHEDRDIDKYSECLHDQYEFFFWEEDTGNPGWQWSLSIVRTEDIEVTQSMFDAEEVTDIQVTFINQSNTGAAEEEDNFYQELVVLSETPGDTTTVLWAEFSLDMHVIEDGGDETIDHWVDGRAKLYFRPDTQYPDLWTIWKVEDLGNRDKKGGRSVSWSELKHSMR